MAAVTGAGGRRGEGGREGGRGEESREGGTSAIYGFEPLFKHARMRDASSVAIRHHSVYYADNLVLII